MFKKLKQAVLDEKYIYRTEDIAFLKHMDEIAPELLKDYLRNHKDEIGLYENEDAWSANGKSVYPLHKGNWKVKVLKYKHQWMEPPKKIEEQYPTAWKLMQTIGYDCPIAMYSFLKANSKIKLHFGADVNLDSKYMRFHIPLVVPSHDPKDVGIEIMGETIGWGCSFAFDNQGWHHVWNNTDQDRVIFLIDIHRAACGIKPSQNKKWPYWFFGAEAIRKLVGYKIRKNHFEKKTLD